MQIRKLFWACSVKFIQNRSTFKTTLFFRYSNTFLVGSFGTVRQNKTIFTSPHSVHCLTQKYRSENIDTSTVSRRLALIGHAIVSLSPIRHRFVPFVVTVSCLLTYGTFSLTVLIALSFNQNLFDPLFLSHLCTYPG